MRCAAWRRGIIGPVTAPLRDFIQANLPLAPVPFVPEIRLHKSAAGSRIGRLALADPEFCSPYWAFYWAGGLVLARFILDHPHIVAGKHVLDLGTGSGLVAIAAAMAGAREVLAVDIDPYALEAASLNAEANGAIIATRLTDPTEAALPAQADVVTVGDLFYEAKTAARVIAFLRRCANAGAEILIGDPGRAYLPREQLDEIASYAVSEWSGSAAGASGASAIFRLKR